MNFKLLSKPTLLTNIWKLSMIPLRHQTINHFQEQDLVFESRLEVPMIPPQQNTIISVINMNNSKTKNALGKDTVYKMLEILDQLQLEQAENNQVRALILRSIVPGIFCSGANLKERRTMSKNQVSSWLRVQRSLMDTISELPCPTVAAIDGFALGGGLELALACDLRIVNEGAKLGLVETRLAIIPGAGGTQRLPRLIGVSKAKEHIFVGEPIDGTEAARIGIANHVVSGENASFNKAVELVSKMCKRGPKALRLTKAAIDKGMQTSLETGLDIEHAYYAQLLDSSDREEGMRAFMEKREPLYTGE